MDTPKTLFDRQIDLAIGIALAIGMLGATFSLFFVLYFGLMGFGLNTAVIHICLPVIFFLSLIKMPLIAPARLRRWTKEGRAVIYHSVLLSGMIALILSMPFAAIGLSWMAVCIGVGIWYGLWVGSVYVASLSLLRRFS